LPIKDLCTASRSSVWVRRDRAPNVLTARLRCRVGSSVKLIPFEMERWQSTWENTVDFNLSESGVQPIPLRELLGDEAATERFLDYPLAILITTSARPGRAELDEIRARLGRDLAGTTVHLEPVPAAALQDLARW